MFPMLSRANLFLVLNGGEQTQGSNGAQVEVRAEAVELLERYNAQCAHLHIALQHGVEEVEHNSTDIRITLEHLGRVLAALEVPLAFQSSFETASKLLTEPHEIARYIEYLAELGHIAEHALAESPNVSEQTTRHLNSVLARASGSVAVSVSGSSGNDAINVASSLLEQTLANAHSLGTHSEKTSLVFEDGGSLYAIYSDIVTAIHLLPASALSSVMGARLVAVGNTLLPCVRFRSLVGKPTESPEANTFLARFRSNRLSLIEVKYEEQSFCLQVDKIALATELNFQKLSKEIVLAQGLVTKAAQMLTGRVVLGLDSDVLKSALDAQIRLGKNCATL